MDALLSQCSKDEQGMANLYALRKFLSAYNLRSHEIKYLYENAHLGCKSFISRAENKIQIKGEPLKHLNQFQIEGLKLKKKLRPIIEEIDNQVWTIMRDS